MTHYYTRQASMNKIPELSSFLIKQGFKPSVYSMDSFNKEFNPNIWTTHNMDIRIYTKKYNLSIDTKLDYSSPEEEPQKRTIGQIMDILEVKELVGSIATETYERSRFG